jgi:hypothetical protein
VDRPVQGAGQRLGLVGGDEVGSGHRPDQQRPAGEHPRRRGAVQQQVGEVLGGVAGGGQGPQRQAAQVDLVAVAQPSVGEGQLGRSRRQHPGPGASKLARPGDEVGVQVSLGNPGDPQTPPLGGGEVGQGIAFGVHQQR